MVDAGETGGDAIKDPRFGSVHSCASLSGTGMPLSLLSAVSLHLLVSLSLLLYCSCGSLSRAHPALASVGVSSLSFSLFVPSLCLLQQQPSSVSPLLLLSHHQLYQTC